jgi:hypothetical protein
MLALKRSSFFLQGKENKLLLNLQLDTEPIRLIGGNRIFTGELRRRKPWVGAVDKPTSKFKIQRADGGLFRSNVSPIEIRGQLIATETQEKIELKYGAPWYVVINFIGVTLFILAMSFFIKEIWVLVIVLSLWIIQILSIIAELTLRRINS